MATSVAYSDVGATPKTRIPDEDAGRSRDEGWMMKQRIPFLNAVLSVELVAGLLLTSCTDAPSTPGAPTPGTQATNAPATGAHRRCPDGRASS